MGSPGVALRLSLLTAPSHETEHDVLNFHFALVLVLVLAAPYQVTLEEGSLVCPETGRKFPVSKGIPNMLLNEDEC